MFTLETRSYHLCQLIAAMGPTFEHHFACGAIYVMGYYGEDHVRHAGNCHHDTEMVQFPPPCLSLKAHQDNSVHTCWLSMLPPFLAFGHPLDQCENSSERPFCMLQWSINLFALKCFPEMSKRCCCDFYHVDKAATAQKGRQDLKSKEKNCSPSHKMLFPSVGYRLT